MKRLLIIGAFLLVLPIAGCTVSPTPAATQGPAGLQDRQANPGSREIQDSQDNQARRVNPVMRAKPATGAAQDRAATEARRDRPVSKAGMVTPHHVQQGSIATQTPTMGE
jgi:hypothetical protein